MRVTADDLDMIQREFGIKNGGWTREALSYVGLKAPLDYGWKVRLLNSGAPDDCPFAKGIKPSDWIFLEGEPDHEEDAAHDAFAKTEPHKYLMLQLNTLENIANDLRKQADAFKDRIRELRSMISKDEF